ncbi:hypothetical protein C2G38_1408841 [Gigaspora rosea]|uniref:Uncharacterized protein n=1 Tax=Gigaspora rosea TaxID=44941 RepID=A0A397W5P8_9GLOM|nr:hypothetical protein C2G38_1408841 [Gigaspora rosea]
MYLTFLNISGVLSSMLYPTNDGPRYFKGHMINAFLLILVVILTVIMRFMLINENKKMDQRIMIGNTWRNLNKEGVNSDTKRQDNEVSDFRYIL